MSDFAGDTKAYLSANHAKFFDVIKEHSYKCQLPLPYKGSFLYIALDGNRPRIDDFLDLLLAHLAQYVYPVKKNDLTLEEVFKKAAKRFSRNPKSGEVGELILYLILECVFHAPQLVAKMRLKTANPDMIKRADAIHVKAESGKLIVYFGESKVHAKLGPAISSALESLKQYITNDSSMDDDILTVEDHAHILGEYRDKFAEFLNPYKESAIRREFVYPLFIAFDTDVYTALEAMSPEKAGEYFAEKYCEDIKEAEKKFKDKTDEKALGTINLVMLLLPFRSVEELRTKFIDKLNG